MTGFSDYSAQNVLNYLAGAKAMPTLPSLYVAAFTAVGTDAGTGFTEVSGGSYARVQISGAVTTNGTTSTASATLNFASVPSWVTVGMYVYDATTPGSVAAAATVISKTGTTVVMSANATGAGVGATDSIVFSAFSSSSGSAPSQITNNAVITFPQSTASWGTVIAFGVYDASSSGNLLYWDYLGNYQWLPTEISSASPGILTVKAHGYSAADNVVFSTEYGGTAPSFSQSNLTGILAVVSPATDSFSVTNSGTAVNTSSTGSGMVRKIIQQSVPINVTMSFAASSLTMTSA